MTKGIIDMFTTRRQLRTVGTGLAVALALLLAGGNSTAGAETVAHAGYADHETDASSDHEAGASGDAETTLRATMRVLWADHMQWTWSTVVAFTTNSDGLEAQLNRLLANQGDIGAAVATFYGPEAGDELTALLTIHITQAVPVLQAAQAGDEAALQAALDDWYVNAEEIADFLSAANPDSWPADATRSAMRHHIDQTTAYASDLLAGDYAAAIDKYDEAFGHMMMLADILTDGILAQFPEHFAG